jgi:hypothetical protein
MVISFVLCSVSSCSFLKKSPDFHLIENNLQSLLDTKKMILCGTIEQFHLSPDQMNNLSSNRSTDFLCSDQFPFIYDSFSKTTIKITGKIPLKDNSTTPTNDIDPFRTDSPVNDSIELYRGYILTDQIHYEGIFQYDPQHQNVHFTIADSLLERTEQNEK